MGWYGEEAELVDRRKILTCASSGWMRTMRKNFLNFLLHVEPLTEEVALIITDFVDADEEGDAIELWNKQVEMLHRTVGG